MLKRVFIVLVIILAFLAASIYIFRANIKRYAIQIILKSFPLPNVALANVNFDETTGRLNLEEIKVKNPKGFVSKYIMEADSIDMDIGFTTKPQLQLNISKVNIADPVFYVERSLDGRWNFREYTKKDASQQASSNETDSLSYRKVGIFDFIEDAFAADLFAAETEKGAEVLLPKIININNGTVHFLDNFIITGQAHKIDFLPITGTLSLDYAPEKRTYEKIRFDGSCNIASSPSRALKGNFEIYPTKKEPSYNWEFNAYNVPLVTIKPYLDTYTPFIVLAGSFNMNSSLTSTDGAVNGSYTMELMDLDFTLNPAKSNLPFLETSVKKLTLYLTNQRGGVVIDFIQKSDAAGNIRWGLGPIAKRAIGLMAIDTVIEVIDAIEKSKKGGEAIPGDIPPEVIDIFRKIIK